MTTKEDKIKINARIPKSLYDWIGSVYDNVSQAVNDSLELLRKTQSENCDTVCDTICNTKNDTVSQNVSQNVSQTNNGDIGSLEESESRGCDTNTKTVSQNAVQLSMEQKARIEDLKTQIQALYEQLHTKDEQLSTKDVQIKDQNENMHKQAVHIQTLIQENSRLNVKLLPENTENKKPWWRFW
jgi:uncharacterized protein (DUF3084 family)